MCSALLSIQCVDHGASSAEVPTDTPSGIGASDQAGPAPAHSCVAFAAPPSPITVTPLFGPLTFDLPTRVVRPPWADAPYYVLQQEGIIQRVVGRGADAKASVFADLRDRTAYPIDPAEGGMLGMVFSPDFATDSEVFLSYTTYSETNLFRRVVTRMKSWDGGLTLDPTTEDAVLDVERAWVGHNGGHIAFGPDGYLYIGLGDGHFGDPEGNGQNRDLLLGKLLRLDVSVKPYAIPPDNPFLDGSARPEIFAIGFRNPWTFSFDSASGDLWLGDVGHHNWEEIDKVTKGANFGWASKEGTHCLYLDPCADPTLTDPVYEYSHVEGTAVTGGAVYHGKGIPELAGKYVFGDYGLGTISVLEDDPITKKTVARQLLATQGAVTSFTEDQDGELLFNDIFSGSIFRIEKNTAPMVSAPALLSATGCVERSDAKVLAPGVIPYEVNVPFWSDGAEKDRAFAIPDGSHIAVNSAGGWTLPTGSVALKTFSFEGRRVETRLLVNHEGLGWSGYTYEWNEAQTDAALLDDRKTTNVVGHDWLFPSRSECTFCHTSAAGRVLGLQAAQLNRGDQLTRLSDLGVFDAPIDPSKTPRLVPADETSVPIEIRARSWLHANCAHCHQLLGPGQGVADLRFDVADLHLCNTTPSSGDLGVAGARLLVPGDPSKSLVYLRASRRGENQMPPLGTSVIDPEGTALLKAWIGSVKICP